MADLGDVETQDGSIAYSVGADDFLSYNGLQSNTYTTYNSAVVDRMFSSFWYFGTDGSIIVGKLLEQGDVNYGYDAQKGEYCDMVQSGIIDPVKVVRTALQDAASVAGLLITTEAMVAEKPEKKAPAMPGGDMGGMGGMDF